MPKESVSVEQGQLLRAAEPDLCVFGAQAKPIPEMLTATEMFSSSHDYCRFLGIQHVCMERMLMIGIGDDRTRSWKTHQVITLILQMRTEWSSAG